MPTDTPAAMARQQLDSMARQLLQTCPDMREQARQIASDLLRRHANRTLEPDCVFFHRFQSAQSSPRTFSGWEHREHPWLSLTLPQLVMQRFDVNDQDNADLLGYLSGFYTDGPDKAVYDQRNEVPLDPRQVLEAFWAIDFASRFTAQANTFWATHSDTFRTLAKVNFLAKVQEECEATRDPALRALYRRVAQALAGPFDTPPTADQLRASQAPGAGIRLSTFDIGGYEASDILRVVFDDGRQLLYTPGEVDALHLLDSADAVHWWILNRTNEADNRARFMAHFALACHGEKGSNVGLNHLIDLLFSGWGSQPARSINQLDKTLHEDAFTHLRDAARQRMFDDARVALRSNAELRKQLWIGYLAAFGQIASGLAAVDWPVALAVVGAGLAETGLNIDQAITGHTTAQRQAGVLGALQSAINTLFNATLLKGAAVDPEPIEAGEVPAAAPTSTPGPQIPDLAPWLPSSLLPAEPDAVLAPFETNVLLDGHTPGEGRLQGIYSMDDGFYVMIDEAPYQVRHVGELDSWVVVDPQTPFSFYRQVPIRLDAEGRWRPLENGLRGGAPRFGVPPWRRVPPLEPLPSTPYEVAEHWRPALLKGANGGERQHLSGYLSDIADPLQNTPYEKFRTYRDLLARDAQAFFSDPPLPPRPAVVAPAPGTNPKALFRSLYEHSMGVVIGEAHSGIGSKRLLIENMSQLAKQQVRVLYLEHLLTDFHQLDLDAFNRSGTFTAALKAYVRELDEGHGTDPDKRYTFLEVLRAARKYRVRVQAIDCMASYRQAWLQPPTAPVRQQMMNFYADRIIRADQAARGPARWVALVGNSHANLFQGVPGLAELEGVVGLRVEDVPIGRPDEWGLDPGRAGVMSGFREVRVQSDLRLLAAVAKPGALPDLPTCLRHVGSFTFKDFDGQLYLVHRSNDGSLVYSVIHHEGEQVFIERPGWPWIHQRRLWNLADLVVALSAHGLKYHVL